jgi:tetratricopeptide (TPR) repeat protein
MTYKTGWQLETTKNLTPVVDQILKKFSLQNPNQNHHATEALLKPINDLHDGRVLSLVFSFRNMNLDNQAVAIIVNTIVQLVPHFEQGIAEIDFSGNRITKIPASIARIKTLKNLKLKCNYALKYLPKSLAKLTHLKIDFRDSGIATLSPWPVKPRAPKAAAAPAETPAIESPAPAVISTPDNSLERHSLDVGQSFYVQNISMPPLPAEIENEGAGSTTESAWPDAALLARLATEAAEDWERDYGYFSQRLRSVKNPLRPNESIRIIIDLCRTLNIRTGVNREIKLNFSRVASSLLICTKQPDHLPQFKISDTSLGLFESILFGDDELSELKEWPFAINDLAMVFYATKGASFTCVVRPLLELALSRLQARLGEHHPDLLPILNNLIAVAFTNEDYEKARELCWDAIGIVQADAPKGIGDIVKLRPVSESAVKFCTALAIANMMLGKADQAISVFDELTNLLLPTTKVSFSLDRSFWLNQLNGVMAMACYLGNNPLNQEDIDLVIAECEAILAALERDQDFYSANKELFQTNLANIKEIASLAERPSQFLLKPVTTTEDFPRHFNDINFDTLPPITCSLPTSFTLKAKLFN